ncbi:MAG: DUF2189 domain-containing protein [Granulosicoccus sp.]
MIDNKPYSSTTLTSADGTILDQKYTVQMVSPSSGFTWLKLGWRDLRRSRFRSVFYGLLFVLMGFAVIGSDPDKWRLTLGLIAGMFFIGPFFATGLYELSRQIQRNEPLDMLVSLFCWARNPGAIGRFSVLLAILMIAWLMLFALTFDLSAAAELRNLTPEMLLSGTNFKMFVICSIAGFFIAATVFAVSVVSVPILLDRQVSMQCAVSASAKSVLRNPLALCIWALLIVLIVGVSFMLGVVLLLVTAPLVGHATWHAYQACISWEQG